MSRARKRKLLLKMSDFTLDMAKVMCASIVFTGVMEINRSNIMILILIGTLAFFTLVFWGFTWYILGTKTN